MSANQPREETPGVAGHKRFATVRRDEPGLEGFASGRNVAVPISQDDDDGDDGLEDLNECSTCFNSLNYDGRQSIEDRFTICVNCWEDEQEQYPDDDDNYDYDDDDD